MDKEKSIYLKRLFRTHGGARVPHRKNTAELKTVIMPPPSQVVISMSQHLGASCVPVVKVGDTVKVGQLIGDSDKYVSAPIHASVSGTVSKITEITLPNGRKETAVVIDSDGEMTLYDEICSPVVTDLEGLIKATRQSGLVGLGGAGFPTHVKLKIPEGKTVDTLIINGAECEPYLTADYREMIENAESVVAGTIAIAGLLKLKNVIIAVEDNKPKALQRLKEVCDAQDGNPIKLAALPSNRYPQGVEKVLIQACTKRMVPKNGLPADVGCLVINVTSISFLAQYLKTGMPLVSRRLTVDGSAITEPMNIIAPIGTPISKIIEFAGGYKGQADKLIMGGPMMGFAQVDDEMPILKQNNGILAFTEKDAPLPEPSNCIHCGRCVQTCPMSLMPTLLESNALRKNIEELERLSVGSCIECGSCTYGCPAGRQIVQSVRLGKSLLREKKRK